MMGSKRSWRCAAPRLAVVALGGAVLFAAILCRADLDQMTLGFQDLITYIGPSPPFGPPVFGTPMLVNVGTGASVHWTPSLLAPWGVGDTVNNVTISRDTLEFTFSSVGLYRYGPTRDIAFIGFRIYDASDDALGVTSVSIDPETTLAGVSAMVDDGYIDVNLKGTGVFYVGNETNPCTGELLNPPQKIVLDMEFAPTPEPSAFALAGAGAIVRLAWLWMRRRRLPDFAP